MLNFWEVDSTDQENRKEVGMLVVDYRKWRSILPIAAISSLGWHEELFISDWFVKEINPGAGIYLFRCLDHRI